MSSTRRSQGSSGNRLCRYHMTEQRAQQLRKLRPLLTDTLVDQLPLLQHLQACSYAQHAC